MSEMDVSDCATYLCPKYSDLFTEYLKNGCINDFNHNNNYMSDVKLIELNDNYDNYDDYCYENINNISISINMFCILIIISSLISLFLGYNLGKYEIEEELKIINDKRVDIKELYY